MKHYVLGFAFNANRSEVLLIQKLAPEWQAGRWNGIGGKIEEGEIPIRAMLREDKEETGQRREWKLVIIFTCPGGTVYVFMADTYVYPSSEVPKSDDLPAGGIRFEQREKELLKVWPSDVLPSSGQVMKNITWMISLCRHKEQLELPILLHQKTLGVH